MLDEAPRESEKQSWIYVAVGVVVIYATIPVARSLREAIDARVGRELFLYLAAALVLLAAALAVRNLRRRRLPPGAYLWLLGILGIAAFFLFRLREIPEEAIHVAEYGILSLLVYRALAHRMRDYSIYAVAFLIVGIVGIVDEYLQWAIPARHFDLRDIATNFAAGGLAQIAVFTGLRPALIRGWPRPRSWGLLCYVVAGMLTLLGLGMQNTPQRVAWYAQQHPALSFLLDGESMMAEYGYRYDDPETGVFRSRFTLEQLRRFDRERGAEVAAILDRYIRGEGYGKFIRRHSVIRDAYAHEAGVHLFRRETYLDRARENQESGGRLYSIAYHENRILKKYFPRAIAYSGHRWDEATENEVSAGADSSRRYESAVSANIISALNVWQMLLFFLVAIVGLLLRGRRLRRGEALT